MSTLSVQSAIQRAVKAEELGVKHYSELARKYSDNFELKEAFELLAKDEAEHKKSFMELAESYGGFTNASEEALEYLQIMDISKHFENLDTTAPLLEVMRRALSFEKDSVLFYDALRDAVGKNDALDSIIDFEKGHVRKLMQYILMESKFRGIKDHWE